MRLNRQIAAWSRLRRSRRHRQSRPASRKRGVATHVIVLDGTMSTLKAGQETNAGLTYKLLADEGPRAGLSLLYDAGVQWPDWFSTHHVISGRGMNRSIRMAYGFLASRYRPGDRIFLFGYSRGAFAVRSLGGVIDRLGLLQAQHATVRNVRQIWRHYEWAPESDAADAFSRAYCHREVPIEMIGVWDTVKALGLRLPLLWRLTEPSHAFHSHALGRHVRRGCHALAHDETRLAFSPELWETQGNRAGVVVEQRWFPGCHGDVGGQLGGFDDARPRSNVPLVWMLEHAEAAGLLLPSGWRTRFPQDITAPSIGTWRGWGKLFLLRERRRIGFDPSETFHPAIDRAMDLAAIAAS
ncbi:DUF2235 domain-containing protein [Tropicimonas isoalkanivorans]|uniref:Uncharacterized alpha/beta hydrolase domain n=1 Tax=Tropicimonas isoalkanivorans TaxID=441112 RepID=A0A1I1NJ78_9RHOB|nr:DUF2235 domain-containing protein [Tropicimonas isoalkanivorans]SFC97597.1 Uncharacterized alpha/beta hydrolase domain [Tropicimonas isoalkanivorans]